MNNVLTIAFLTITLLSLAACGSTGAIVVKGVVTGARILRGVTGSAADRDTLCKYYNDHRAEVEAVRAWAKTNWSEVPAEYKPALLAINEQLNACDTPGESHGKPTAAASLLEAFKKAVTLYRELKAAGVL